MFKDLLVCLEGSPSSVRATEAAIATCKTLGASLTGLAVVDEPAILANQPVGIGGSSYKHDRDEALLADAHAHAREWLEDFRRRSGEAGVVARSIERRGRP